MPQRTSLHLAIIVSRALQLQGGRIPCPVDRNLEIFLFSHIDFLFIFEQCGDNCKQNLFLERKVGVIERLGTLNPVKAIAMAICPIICSFYYLERVLDAWRGIWICVHSEDAQKQLARKSLK